MPTATEAAGTDAVMMTVRRSMVTGLAITGAITAPGEMKRNGIPDTGGTGGMNIGRMMTGRDGAPEESMTDEIMMMSRIGNVASLYMLHVVYLSLYIEIYIVYIYYVYD